MKFERNDARVGLLIILALGIFSALLFHRVFDALLGKQTVMKIRLANVSDLEVGTEVHLQGLRAGKVDRIDLERQGAEYRFLVTLSLRPDIVLWNGTKAVITSKVLGGSYVDLQLPPPAMRTVELAPGAILDGASSGSLASLIATLDTFVRHLDETLTELRGHVTKRGLGSLFEHPEMRKVMRNLDATLTEFRTLAKDGQKLARHGDDAAQAATRDLERLEKSLAVLQKILESREQDVDAIVTNLAAVLKNFKGLSAEALELLKAGGPGLAGSMDALHRDLQQAEELLEILKAKPNRLVFGTPTAKEKADAHEKAKAAEQEAAAKREKAKTDP